MPVQRQKPDLVLTEEQRGVLTRVSSSRSDQQRRVERARILVAFADGESISGICRRLGTYRRKVERLVDKALALGPLAALDDLQRSGRPTQITPQARAWLLSLACQKPKALGYSYELWTTDLLARHAREHCRGEGHPSLAQLARGTVSKILNRRELRPHKVRYYLERRDPEFDRKMVDVLHVYREVEVIREHGGDPATSTTAYISYDEEAGHPGHRHHLSRSASRAGRLRSDLPGLRVQAPRHIEPAGGHRLAQRPRPWSGRRPAPEPRIHRVPQDRSRQP